MAVVGHDLDQDYSAWLLSAVARVLAPVHVRLSDVELFAVAAGPGSFTGLRVGLTAVKAWAEVYNRPIVPMSRLEALSLQALGNSPFVAAFFDARRGQIFAGLYRRSEGRLERVGEEAVLSAADFLAFVEKEAGSERVAWVSLDPDCLTREPGWAARANRGESVLAVEPVLAPAIGQLAFFRAAANELVDALTLDANYVRRSDAEIFWKGGAHGR
jgi:tRNA threonylcarbamoyladenosine biosynthesis protein TsaB